MKNLFYIILVFIVLYLGADILVRGESEGSRPVVQMIAGVSLIGMLIYNNYYFGKRITLLKVFDFSRLWLIFVVLGVFYFLLSFIEFPSIYANINLRSVIILVYVIASMFFFYNATINLHLKGKALNLLLLALILNGCLEVFLAIINPLNSGGIRVVNTSAGYIFLMILPMLMYRFQKYNFWVFGLALVLTLMSGKRGAVVIYIFIIIYSLRNFKGVFKNFKFDWKAWLFLAILFVVGLYFIENAYDSLSHRFLNIEDEKRGTIGSGRDVIWSTLIYFWADGSVFNQVFGFGFYASPKIEGHIAHNDFVEYLIDFGILGLLLWSLMLFRFYKNIKRVKKYDKYLYTLLFFCLVVFVGRGFFAGTNRTDNIVLSISMGYILGITCLKLVSLRQNQYMQYQKDSEKQIGNLDGKKN
ncbi:O-antigen ligase family protein [Winogradskyella poriferorum]|uniref:O-antigen ligase family protein n=1 Tax=Winogradskyella poriferorum TaxID=307627 RepID=A0ABU7W1H4_9FLAO